MKEDKGPHTALSETNWFPHDMDCVIDRKFSHLLRKYGAYGYAVFWRVVELLHEEQDHTLDLEDEMFIEDISSMFKIDPVQVREIIVYAITKCQLFKSDGSKFYSSRVNRNIARKNVIKEARRKAGAKGGKRRAEGLANANQKPSNSQANDKQLSSKAQALPKQNVAEERRLSPTEREAPPRLPDSKEYVNDPSDGLGGLVLSFTQYGSKEQIELVELIRKMKPSHLELVSNDFKNFSMPELLKTVGVKDSNSLKTMLLNYLEAIDE